MKHVGNAYGRVASLLRDYLKPPERSNKHVATPVPAPGVTPDKHPRRGSHRRRCPLRRRKTGGDFRQ